MKNLSLMEIVVLSAALICIPLVTRAALDESKVIEGIVQAVGDNKISVIAQSMDDQQSNVIDFQVQPETSFEGVVKDQIKEGDKVKVGFSQNEQAYIAESVMVAQ